MTNSFENLKGFRLDTGLIQRCREYITTNMHLELTSDHILATVLDAALSTHQLFMAVEFELFGKIRQRTLMKAVRDCLDSINNVEQNHSYVNEECITGWYKINELIGFYISENLYTTYESVLPPDSEEEYKEYEYQKEDYEEGEADEPEEPDMHKFCIEAVDGFNYMQFDLFDRAIEIECTKLTCPYKIKSNGLLDMLGYKIDQNCTFKKWNNVKDRVLEEFENVFFKIVDELCNSQKFVVDSRYEVTRMMFELGPDEYYQV